MSRQSLSRFRSFVETAVSWLADGIVCLMIGGLALATHVLLPQRQLGWETLLAEYDIGVVDYRWTGLNECQGA